MIMAGADIRKTMTLPDGSAGHVTLNFENNYSTNTFLSNGQIFSNTHGLQPRTTSVVWSTWFCNSERFSGSSGRGHLTAGTDDCS